jgi:Fe-S-cluster containining protein
MKKMVFWWFIPIHGLMVFLGNLLMLHEFRTFLTLAQAIDAVAADFVQYGPQPDLFREIAPLILKNNFKIGIFNGVKRVWVRPNCSQPFTPEEDTALGFYFIHLLETSEMDAVSLAQICALVFQTSVIPGVDEGKSGVWIESDMNAFVCKRCGNCCSGLENGCLREDRQSWELLGRSDILSWVKAEQLDSGEVQYRIWIDPQTGESAESCPFLAQQQCKGTFHCTIQAVKPLVCREYPFTKKHALHTGCRGFESMTEIDCG